VKKSIKKLELKIDALTNFSTTNLNGGAKKMTGQGCATQPIAGC